VIDILHGLIKDVDNVETLGATLCVATYNQALKDAIEVFEGHDKNEIQNEIHERTE